MPTKYKGFLIVRGKPVQITEYRRKGVMEVHDKAGQIRFIASYAIGNAFSLGWAKRSCKAWVDKNA